MVALASATVGTVVVPLKRADSAALVRLGVRNELRILDANLNRAREALRVMEDIARFGLDEHVLARGLKEARHGLREIAERAGIDAALLAVWRDTPGDVGTGMTTSGESTRRNLRDVAIGAGKRAGEALRVLEEMFKAIGDAGTGDRARCAEDVKQLRYRVYTLEQCLIERFGSGMARQWRLCVLISESLCTHHSWERVAEMAIEGGANCLQLREKTMSGGELLRRARWLVDIAIVKSKGREQASVIINDRPDIAVLSEADGVHIGQGDVPANEARKIVGFNRLVGVSTSCLEEAHAARDSGADYCGVGAMFATATKDKPRVMGVEYLRAYLSDERVGRVPHLAIGGITPENVAELARAGCRGVALSSVVCGADKPREVCEALVRVMSQARE